MLKVLADQHDAPIPGKPPAFWRGRCLPTIGLIADKTRMCRNAVSKALEHLEADRFIRIERRYGARHEYVLTLDPQLTLREVPKPRTKRDVGFRARRKSEPPAGQEPIHDMDRLPGSADPEPMHHVHGFSAPAEPEPIHHMDRQPIHDMDRHRSTTWIGSPGSPSSSVLPVRTNSQTATASPRLPFPLAVKHDRSAAEKAKAANEHRLDRLRRRVAGCVIAILKNPAAMGLALINEPVPLGHRGYAQLVAATKVLCGKRGIEGYAEVLEATCARVGFRYTEYGQAVIGGRAPRPRDLATRSPRGPRR